MDNDLQLAKNTLHEMDALRIDDFDPHIEVSTTIVSLLRNITERFDSDDAYNSKLKEALIARLPEATWSEIAMHLSSREMNENIRLKEILSPFIPKDGDRIPLMDNNRKELRSDEKLFNGSTKENLQAMETLTRVLMEYRKQKNAQVNVTTNDADKS